MEKRKKGNHTAKQVKDSNIDSLSCGLQGFAYGRHAHQPQFKNKNKKMPLGLCLERSQCTDLTCIYS